MLKNFKWNVKRSILKNNNSINTSEKINKNPIFQIILLGVLTSLTIFCVSLLHTNLPEFIGLRFPALTPFDISLFDTVLYSAYLIMGISTGIISEHLGRRKIFVIIGSLGNIIFFLLMTITLIYPLLLLFRFIQGCFTVLSWQILMTLILDLSTPENRGKNMGIFGIFLSLSMGLGPMLGGFIAEQGVFFPYYTSSILSLIIFILAIILLKEPKFLKKNPSIKQNLSIINRNPKLIMPGIFNFVDRLHMGFLIFILQFYILAMFALGPEFRGMILGIFALPYILLQYPIGRLSDKYGRYKPLIFGSICYGIVLSLIGWVGSIDPFGFILFIFLMVLLGIFSGVTGPPSMALVGDIVDKKDNAMGMGFFNFLGNLGIILGPLIGGSLITYLDYTTTFIIVGSVELISLAIVILLVVRVFKENPFKARKETI